MDEQDQGTSSSVDKRAVGFFIAVIACVGFAGWKADQTRREHLDFSDLARQVIPKWVELNDGTGVAYRVFSEFVQYSKYFSDDHFVFAYLGTDDFSATAYWKADCEDGTEIETSVKFRDGEPAKLKCWGGDTVMISVASKSGNPMKWKRDYDGFAVDVDFREWDWTKARQFNTLLKAKPIPYDTED
jgi:hypothetical protein